MYIVTISKIKLIEQITFSFKSNLLKPFRNLLTPLGSASGSVFRYSRARTSKSPELEAHKTTNINSYIYTLLYRKLPDLKTFTNMQRTLLSNLLKEPMPLNPFLCQKLWGEEGINLFMFWTQPRLQVTFFCKGKNRKIIFICPVLLILLLTTQIKKTGFA